MTFIDNRTDDSFSVEIG